MDELATSGSQSEAGQLKRQVANLEARVQALSHERKNLRYMAKVFRESADPIIIEDFHGRIIDLNEETERMYGWDRDELIGRPLKLIMPPESHQQGETLLAQCRQGQMIRNVEVMRVNKAGEQIPILLTLSLLTNGDGEGTAVASMHKDIRELKKAEAAIRKTQKLESLGVLAGSIAHDFNNLLVAILGQASLALYKLKPENPASLSIKKAVYAAERAADLTRQLLAYSGGGQFVIKPVNLNKVIEENQQFLKTVLPKNIKVHTKLADTLPLISADISQMQQVIMNLIINAAETYEEKPGSVTVKTSYQTITTEDTRYWQYSSNPLPPGAYVILEVSDNGQGMAKETIAKIFDPFFTTKKGGRGLGLAAVLGIVQGHKGGLNIYSEVGNGTTFKLLFPTTAQPSQMIEQAIPEIQMGTGVILVIDDEELVCEAIADILGVRGFKVLIATSGKQGLALFEEHADDINLVLMDLSIPGLSGIKLFKRLRNIKQDVPIVLASGYDQTKAVRHFAGRRVAGFLQKPFSSNELFETVSKYVNGDNIGR